MVNDLKRHHQYDLARDIIKERIPELCKDKVSVCIFLNKQNNPCVSCKPWHKLEKSATGVQTKTFKLCSKINCYHLCLVHSHIMLNYCKKMLYTYVYNYVAIYQN